MQLISTEQYHEPSTEYYKRALSIDQIQSETEMWQSQRMPLFSPLLVLRPPEEEHSVVLSPIKDIFRPSVEEDSVFLRLIKDIELLERRYTFNNPIEAKGFLLRHDYLINLLFEAYEQIKRVFRESTVEVCLEYDRDPEEDFEGLFVIVRTNLPPEESLDLLDRFDEAWFLDNVSGEIGSLFTVTVRPI